MGTTFKFESRATMAAIAAHVALEVAAADARAAEEVRQTKLHQFAMEETWVEISSTPIMSWECAKREFARLCSFDKWNSQAALFAASGAVSVEEMPALIEKIAAKCIPVVGSRGVEGFCLDRKGLDGLLNGFGWWGNNARVRLVRVVSPSGRTWWRVFEECTVAAHAASSIAAYSRM